MSQTPSTNLECALLGLVGMGPASGYDVHKVFATTPLGTFSSSPGAIYPALRRLERRGLLKARLDKTTETRPRRVYSLTRAGEAALYAWLRQHVTREELMRNTAASILRFSLAEGRLSPPDIRAYLQGWRRELLSYLDYLRGFRRLASDSSMLHPGLALEHGIMGFETNVAWTDRAIAQIKQRRGRPRLRPTRSPRASGATGSRAPSTGRRARP